MTQNTSPAVMQQRAATPPDALDYFPTPPWATRAVCEWLYENTAYLGALNCWEPACGEGHMVRPLLEYFGTVRYSDVHRYNCDHAVRDFLDIGDRWQANDALFGAIDFIITNPPFILAAQFIARALEIARTGVVMIARQAFTEGATRYRDIFAPTPPAYELQFTERVVMLKGRLIQDGAPDPFNLDAAGKPRKASTASAAIALVWLRDADGAWITDTRKRWLAPCRRRLERPGDYPAYPEQWAAIERPDEGDLLS